MPSPVRLSRSRRILAHRDSRSPRRSNSSSSSSTSKRAPPGPDEPPNQLPSPRMRQSLSTPLSRRSQASVKFPSRRRPTSRSSDSPPDNVQELRQASPTRLYPPKQTRFGIPVPTNQPRVVGNFDFEEKYPEDPIYEELGPNARVWRANLDECEVFDNDMVTEARDGLDLMLVFAGLFSAVLSTFVAQTSQALSNNFPAVSTALLLEMVTLQRAFINGSSIDNISTSEMSSGPSGFDTWVNALWFTSLALSLGTALTAVVVKQWLYQYMSQISGTARDRSLIRFYRFDEWHVLTIISVLPIVLHVALGVFLVGLVVFLIPFNIPFAIVVSVITAAIVIMYAISNVLPILYTQCPYRTPFSDILNVILRPLLAFLASVASAFASTPRSPPPQVIEHNERPSGISSAVARICKAFTPSAPKKAFRTLKEAERVAATNDAVAEEIAADALSWLYQVTSNQPTKNVVLQSTGCLSDDVKGRLTAICLDVAHALTEVREFGGTSHYWSILPGQEARAEKLLRSDRHNYHSDSQIWTLKKEECEHPFQLPLSILTRSTSWGTQIEFTDIHTRQWRCEDLFEHILQHGTIDTLHFPSTLWRLLFRRYLDRQSWGMVNVDLSFKVCQLAVQSLVNDTQMDKPFSGGVPITHPMAHLLEFAAALLLYSVSEPYVQCEPLRQLLTMNDFIISKADDLAIHVTLPAFRDIWSKLLRQAQEPQLLLEDRRALCHRAEELILRVFVDGAGMLGELSDGSNQYWLRVLETYGSIYHGVGNPEFFKRLLVALCSTSPISTSSKPPAIASIVDNLLTQVQDQAYFMQFCESPLFSPGPTIDLVMKQVSTRAGLIINQRTTHLYPIFSAFVAGLARGHVHLKVTLRCMDYLCAEPDRIFTVCRILALESNGADVDDLPKEPLLQIASIAPTHPVWMARAHYMSMDPKEWPYLCLTAEALDDEDTMDFVEERMQAALKILDDYLTSFEHAPLDARPPSTPEEYCSDIGTMPSVGTRASGWRRRVLRVVTSFRSGWTVSLKPAVSTSAMEMSSPPAAEVRSVAPLVIPFLSIRFRDALSSVASLSSGSVPSTSASDAHTENVV